MVLGEQLRKKREELGFSPEAIYQRTKIRRKFIEAMEKEDWESFASPAQARAFLRKYMQALGLSQELMEEYEDSIPTGPTVFKPVKERNIPKDHLGLILKITLGILIILILGVGIWLGERYYGKVLGKKETGKEPAIKEEVVQNKTVPSSTLPSEPSTTTPTQAPKVQKENISEHRLVLSCNERTWVRIYLDSEPVKEYLFNPGDRYEWVAKEGFEIKIGNAAGVELEYNGKKYQNLGRKGHVILLKFPESYQRRVLY